MAIPVLVIGRSGSGKSASMRNLKDAFVINVTNKPLPFRVSSDSLKQYATDDYTKIKGALLKAQENNITTCVIDDAGYLITNAFMRGHGSGKGNQVFELYNTLADEFWKLLFFIQHELSEKTVVYIMMHEATNELTGEVKPKTIGKMLDEKVCIEGLCTIVLHAVKYDGKYVFKTNTDGLDCAKSPMGMFDSEMIDNDLNEVNNIIKSYYNL